MVHMVPDDAEISVDRDAEWVKYGFRSSPLKETENEWNIHLAHSNNFEDELAYWELQGKQLGKPRPNWREMFRDCRFCNQSL